MKSSNLKKLRSSLDLTQKEASDICKVSERQWRKYEKPQVMTGESVIPENVLELFLIKTNQLPVKEFCKRQPCKFLSFYSLECSFEKTLLTFSIASLIKNDGLRVAIITDNNLLLEYISITGKGLFPKVIDSSLLSQKNDESQISEYLNKLRLENDYVFIDIEGSIEVFYKYVDLFIIPARMLPSAYNNIDRSEDLIRKSNKKALLYVLIVGADDSNISFERPHDLDDSKKRYWFIKETEIAIFDSFLTRAYEMYLKDDLCRRYGLIDISKLKGSWLEKQLISVKEELFRICKRMVSE